MEEPLLVLMGEKKWEETHQYTFQLLYVPKKKNLLNFYLSFFFMVVSLKQQAWATDDVAQIYDKCITELEQHLHAIPPTLAMNPQTHMSVGPGGLAKSETGQVWGDGSPVNHTAPWERASCSRLLSIML